MKRVEKLEDIEPDLKLITPWTLWEFYKMESRDDDYNSLMKQVTILSTAKEFARTWAYLPHCNPSQIFFNRETREHLKQNKLIRFEVEPNNWKIIETICLFREGIFPGFEDEKNENGGGLYYVFDTITVENLDNIWKNLCCAIVGEDITLNELVVVNNSDKWSQNSR